MQTLGLGLLAHPLTSLTLSSLSLSLSPSLPLPPALHLGRIFTSFSVKCPSSTPYQLKLSPTLLVGYTALFGVSIIIHRQVCTQVCRVLRHACSLSIVLNDVHMMLILLYNACR